MQRFLLLSLLTCGVISGCGRQVIVFGHTVAEGREPSQGKPVAENNPAARSEPPAIATAQAPSKPAVLRVNSVTVELTSPVTTKAENDPRFKPEALLEAVQGELRSRELFDPQDPRTSGTAEVLIDDFGVRPTSNVVLFGYIPSAGTLSGSIRVRDARGNELQNFRIVAETRLRIAASGDDGNPLELLYRRFANLAADSLAGTPSKSDDTSGNVVPR